MSFLDYALGASPVLRRIFRLSTKAFFGGGLLEDAALCFITALAAALYRVDTRLFFSYPLSEFLTYFNILIWIFAAYRSGYFDRAAFIALPVIYWVVPWFYAFGTFEDFSAARQSIVYWIKLTLTSPFIPFLSAASPFFIGLGLTASCAAAYVVGSIMRGAMRRSRYYRAVRAEMIAEAEEEED